jgi:hypothetical protein
MAMVLLKIRADSYRLDLLEKCLDKLQEKIVARLLEFSTGEKKMLKEIRELRKEISVKKK